MSIPESQAAKNYSNSGAIVQQDVPSSAQGGAGCDYNFVVNVHPRPRVVPSAESGGRPAICYPVSFAPSALAAGAGFNCIPVIFSPDSRA